MKLVKLSLVAAMAAGFMASTASATPLDELIKNVDASGYARMRYNTERVKDGDSKSNWQFKTKLKLKTMIDDNFFLVVGGDYTNKDQGYTKEQAAGGVPQVEAKGRVSDFYFGYKIAGTTFTLGRQAVGSFFTDDMFGDGLKVVNTDVEGLTLAAMYMDALEADSDIGTGEWAHNLYGVAAMGEYDPFNFQLWYVVLEDVTDLFAAELGFDFDINDNVNIGIKGQYAFADLDGDVKKAGVADDSDFWAIEASTKLFGLDLAAGYVNYSTDKDKESLSSFEDAGSFIKYGEQLAEDYNFYKGENDYFFISAGYEVPNSGVSFGLEYLDGKNETNVAKTDKKEYVGRLGYQATEQLKFSSYYSHYKEEVGNKEKKTDKFRFEAKYSF